jgi:hypothetical protein
MFPEKARENRLRVVGKNDSGNHEHGHLNLVPDDGHLRLRLWGEVTSAGY